MSADEIDAGAEPEPEDLTAKPEATSPEYFEVSFADVVRARQSAALPTPRAAEPNLPLGDLDPEVLERLAAEMVKRRPNLGAHFYGRRGQKQHGLDVLEREAVDANSVYQVRRYAVLTPDEITSAVTEYAGPRPIAAGAERPPRSFDALRYVLFTSAEFEAETALQDRLEDLQRQYSDLIIEVWGREMISGLLRDSGALVNSVFGAEWASVFCGFAPPPPGPADPDPLGLVESPIRVLNLDAMVSDAQTHETAEPLEAARLYSIVADTLAEANFSSHAAAQRRRQAHFLRAGGDTAGAFAVLFGLAAADFTEGATRMLGPLEHALDALRPDLDGLQAAKLDVLAAAYAWYECGSQLAVAVPALETVVGAGDPDAAFLACITLEQAVVDGWPDLDPPRSLVMPDGNTADLMARLRRCAFGPSCGDVMVRARLACALADASLASDSTPADVDSAFMPLMQAAGAGRYLHAGGLVFARAAHAFAMHGDTARAIDLWRQAIRLSSESRLYGDVAGCRLALNAAILEQPVPAFDELAPPGQLPNANRLLAVTQEAELYALRAAHDGKLPDAFSVARRHHWEARLSGHLTIERQALDLFGDVLLAAEHPDVAVIAWVMGGAGGKAANLSGQLAVPVGVGPWARSPARACQAAAARVIGAQARLYGPGAADEPVRVLLDMTSGLWTEPRIAPTPALDAVNALCKFGRDLPATAVDPIIALLQPRVRANGALTPELAELMIQIYWAVPSRRDDLAKLIGAQLALGDPPPGLWELTGNLPESARGPVTAAVSDLADAGHVEALRTLVRWKEATDAVQLVARRTCAHLLRQIAGAASVSWSVSTRFGDVAMLLDALASADTLAEADPRELQPGAGPILPEKTLMSMTLSAGPAPADAGDTTRPDADQIWEGSAEQAGTDSGSGTPGPVETAPTGDTPGTEPDPQARTAAGSPSDLAAAVAEHLLAVAESHDPPAFHRADAIAALHSLLGHLSPGQLVRAAGRLLAVAENPGLNAYDQLELSSQNPLSRGRLDIGARSLPTLALVTAATAAALAADREPEVERPSAHAVQIMISQAVQLLHSPDQQASKHGATVLAVLPKLEPSLARYADALIVHPNAGIRTVAASIAVLDEQAQRILAADSAPQVRAALAGRSRDLAGPVVALLRADEHPDVKRAMAAQAGPGYDESA